MFQALRRGCMLPTSAPGLLTSAPGLRADCHTTTRMDIGFGPGADAPTDCFVFFEIGPAVGAG